MKIKPNLVVAGLLDYLEETGQRQLLPEVTAELEKLLEEAKEAQAMTITSAVPLSLSQSEALAEILGRVVGANLPIIKKVDKNLLGGFTIKVGDWFLDASLLHQLAYLKKFMLS